MNKITIKLANRNWGEYRKQNIIGEIVKVKNDYRVYVDIEDFPGIWRSYKITNKIPLNTSLNTRKVIGDIGFDGFNIKIICIGDVVDIS